MKITCWIIRGLFISAFCVLVINMYAIQVKKGGEYARRAQAQQESRGMTEPVRGGIFFTDKNGTHIPAVINKEYPIIYAVPTQIKDPQETAKRVAVLLHIDEITLEKQLSKKNDQYELLVAKASPEQVDAIKTAAIEGLFIKNETFRYYPFRELAAHVLGIVSPSSDGTIAGRYGIEKLFDSVLRGIAGAFLGSKEEAVPIAGNEIHLTIDRTIQAEAEKTITRLIQQWNGTGATAIVQDPMSGRILAMASAPTFDPNEYGSYDLKTFLNPAVEAIYEPGSIFKPITMSAGIDSGAITPDTTYVDKGYIQLDKYTIKNWDGKAHGKQTMTNVIEKSLNTGTVFAQRTMGRKVFADYVKQFGFSEKTGVKLPGEVRSNSGNLEKGREAEYATMSYGQGISVTPIAMIGAFSAIANGGVLMRPLITQDEKAEVVRRVISVDTAKKVTDMMVSAVEINQLARVPHYRVAGKTGTAFIPVNGGYSEERVIHSYVGFAPADNPRFVVYLKLTEPSAPLAGQTVVPAFQKMAEFLLNYYEVAPDTLSEAQ